MAAAVPLVGAALAPEGQIIPVVVIATLISLAGLGALGAQAGGAPKLRATARLDHVDEDLVDLQLQGLQVVDIALLFRLEGIQDHLVFARRIDAAFDADLLQKLGETEAAGDHADRADNRGWIGNNLV